MAYDEGLAHRISNILAYRNDVVEKKMFGGLCFMISDHMSCGIVGDTLMARVGPDNYEKSLQKENVSEMDFTGRAMKGMIYVSPDGLETDEDLEYWLKLCVEFVLSLPPKKKK